MSPGHHEGTDALTYNQLGGMTLVTIAWSVGMRLGAVTAGIHPSRTVLPMWKPAGCSIEQSDQLALAIGKAGFRKWSLSQHVGPETVRELAANSLQPSGNAFHLK